MTIETGVIGVICTALGALIPKLFEYFLAKKKQDATLQISDQEFLFTKYRQLITDLQQKVVDIEALVKDLQSKYTLTREENIHLTETLKAYRKECDGYKAELERCMKELDALKKKGSVL